MRRQKEIHPAVTRKGHSLQMVKEDRNVPRQNRYPVPITRE